MVAPVVPEVWSAVLSVPADRAVVAVAAPVVLAAVPATADTARGMTKVSSKIRPVIITRMIV